MDDLEQILLKLDKLLLKLYKENFDNENALKKTDFRNAAGHKSLVVDLLLEDATIDFLKEEQLPCILEAEERGRTIISNNPEYLVIADPLDGSNNFRRRIPLVCYGIGIAKLPKNEIQANFNDMQIATVRAYHSDEFFIAKKNHGAFCNGNKVQTASAQTIPQAMIAHDLDRIYGSRLDIVAAVLNVLENCRATRRFGANILDIVYVGAGKIEAMIDIREMLSAVHSPAVLIAKECGCVVAKPNGTEFNPILRAKDNISLIVACTQQLLDEILQVIQ